MFRLTFYNCYCLGRMIGILLLLLLLFVNITSYHPLVAVQSYSFHTIQQPLFYDSKYTLHHKQQHSSESLFSKQRNDDYEDYIDVDVNVNEDNNSRSNNNNNNNNQETIVQFNITLTDEKIRQLYAWICQAFYNNDERYNNLIYAMIAIFGTSTSTSSSTTTISPITKLLNIAMEQYNDTINENRPMGEIISQYDREMASLGAMGAGQWLRQYKTRPHSILDITNYTNIIQWDNSLVSRSCKRTIQRTKNAEQIYNYYVLSKPIHCNYPAPHSTYQHFKCVVQHEVRLLSSIYGNNSNNDNMNYIDNINVFFNALSEAISRYIGTTQMTGLIREYRYRSTNNNNNNNNNNTAINNTNNTETNINENDEIIAFAHEIRKGNTVRGQWFYATDTAAKQYVWFHSVRSLIERSIEYNNHCDANNNNTTSTGTGSSRNTKITTIDLGPSNSNEFIELKTKYGFIYVDDWPMVTNYIDGPFWDYTKNQPFRTDSSTQRSFLRFW